jgi:hypothetical protein
VEIVDILNSNKTVYGSMREAAAAIGCVVSTIRIALNNHTGESRLIKKRFQVKRI